jgi:exopolysaccharide biosynthesis polyprenyl glycosylphosphotransferase
MRREQYKHLLNFGACLLILLFETAMFAYMWYYFYVPLLTSSRIGFYNRGNWAVIGMYALVIYFFTRAYGGYKIGYLRITDVSLSQTLALLCANAIGYIQICIVFRDYMNPEPILGLTFFELIVVLPGVYLIRLIYTRLYPAKKTLVIYGEYSPVNLIGKINSRKDRYNICATESVKVGYETLYKRILEYEAVVLCDLPSQIRNQILKFCYDQKRRTYVTPKISDIIVTGADKIHLFDTPLLLARNHGLTIEQRIGKRLADIILSLLLLIITSPFMLIFALCIKVYDGGTVFYRQERLTIDGKTFPIIKFRSMMMNSERDGARLAKKGDSRITPIGKFLRATHLDELPQIINIFKGEMSFVGPRPERAEIAAEYEELVPEFGFRLKVKAGLTGYAQIYGKYNTAPYDKLKLDLFYIENYSMWLDFKLILMTSKIIFQKENTEGVDATQKTAVKD